MKTTLNIDDRVMRELKREAAKRGRTMSEMVEAGIRLVLKKDRPPGEIPPLPSFSSGGALLDYADREALYRAMDEDDLKSLYRTTEDKK
ncbi:MAG: ribbon-helix-helix protein, CopG family [Rhodospirillales bacterium]|nr:ribbon-helix-helix protein, CopG family [Rhodospirillales bacterium]